MKKIIFYLVLLVIGIFVFFNFEPKKEVDIHIKEQNTFPPKEILDDLEKMQVQ